MDMLGTSRACAFSGFMSGTLGNFNLGCLVPVFLRPSRFPDSPVIRYHAGISTHALEERSLADDNRSTMKQFEILDPAIRNPARSLQSVILRLLP